MKLTARTLAVALAPVALLHAQSGPPTSQPYCPNEFNDRWACEADFYYQGDRPLSGQPNDHLQHMGYAVAGWGDFDGDGAFDVSIGSLRDHLEELCPVPEPVSNVTRLWISLGPQSCLSAAPAGFCQQPSSTFQRIVNPSSSGSRFAFEVSFVGDLDGDGRDELAVGAPVADSATATDCGAVYVLFLKDRAAFVAAGPAGDIDAGVPGIRIVGIRGEGQSDWFGYSIAGPGDVCWSTARDVLVGAPSSVQSPSTLEPGKAYVIDGDAVSAAMATASTGVSLPPRTGPVGMRLCRSQPGESDAPTPIQ